MVKISLKEIIDDILLLIRNNYISESEDLSREQIHLWVKTYKKQLWKEELDRKKLLFLQNRLDIEELIDMLNDHSFGEQADILSRALYNTSSVSSYPTTIGELKRLCEKENIVNAGWYMKDYIEEMNANGWKDENGSPIKSVGTHFREWLKRNEEECGTGKSSSFCIFKRKNP